MSKHEHAAAIGVEVLGRYISQTGQNTADIEDGTAISDLISDVLHVAHDHNLDIDTIMRRAYDNVHAEIEEQSA